jgi:Carboxypeptidase regulatory-like domain/TonB-dependent Receptor Plug Domain
MNKKHLLTLSLLLVSIAAAWSQATLTGKVVDDKNEPVYGALVVLYKNGVQMTGGQSDFDGLYRVSGIQPGKYDVECSIVGSAKQRTNGVQLSTGLFTVNFKMESDPKLLKEVVITEYKVPIVKVDQTVQGKAFTSEEILKMPLKDVNSIVATTAGVSTNAKGTEVNIRGARSTGTDYYIDGIRVRGAATVPINEVEQLQVVTGGIEAKYGDVTGGLISITTKGPANKFSGGAELETSQFLTPYGYNFANMNLSGPIISKTRKDKTGGSYKESLLGFRISGQMRQNLDDDPPATRVYRVKPEVLEKLEKNPWTTIGAGTPVSSAELLQREDFDALRINPNNKYGLYEFTGKLEGKVTKQILATLSGNYSYNQNQITPGGWGVFNVHNNPTELRDRARVNFRIRHRLGNATTEGGKKSSGLSFENASYTLQFGWEQDHFNVSDKRHGDDVFAYGYVGKFNTSYLPTLQQDSFGNSRHIGYLQQLTGYSIDEIYNPVLANYNRDASGKPLDAGGNLHVLNGSYNLNTLRDVYNRDFYRNVGQSYNLFQKDQGNLITGRAELTFDLLPNGSKDRAHQIEMGFLYEQRVDRSYKLRPFNLWLLADQLQNRIINGTAIDTLKRVRDSLTNGQRVPIYAPLINNDLLGQTDFAFYKRLRDKLGQPLNSYTNVSGLTPSDLSLSMFTPFELTSTTIPGSITPLLEYYGYDYLGNPVGAGQYSFNDFFTAKDANGVRTFPVAPIQPLYVAGHIQDKFRYKDVIFSLGFRVDRFDANTKVLKDPYSLYDIMSAKDFYQNILKQDKPTSVADDAKVYLNANTFGQTAARYTEADIKAFRVGDQWYNPKGAPVDPVATFGENAQTFAKYIADTFPTIKQLGYDPNISFTDYKPQTNIMPRMAFSFPIGEKANFFAHYDILVARPLSDRTIQTALDYFYFDETAADVDGIQNNPNLLPEKTIDYEVGFQQQLTPTSGIKIAAYYREMRNQPQLIWYRYLPTPLKTTEYQTYGNVDFGTVKGFSFQYDLRRTNHFSGQFNYTLQFADGTGSDPSTQRNLNRRGNIRTLSPLNFDERHRFAVNLDYRYDDPKYDGPVLFGAEVFKNAGINMQLNAVSGRPYTKRKTALPFDATQIDGLINGSNLPWNFTVDMRIDRNFTIAKTAKRPLNLNVYFRVQNLLDTRNVARVYLASGAPDDDGYLASARGQAERNNILTSRGQAALQSYLFLYDTRMINPDFFYLPRRMFLGCMFDF